MFTFGKVPTDQTEDKFDLGMSDDKRAFTLTFNDLKVTSEAGQPSAAPISAHVFSLVVPIEGYGKNLEIEFAVSGTVVTKEGANATLMLSVNGQTSVADFPANSDESPVQKLKFTAEAASECRLSLLLLVGRDSKDTSTVAFLNAMAIDAEILPRAA
ncbi:MAG TPA: hypothetical protein VLV76_04235 [Candidatus Acidoferrum sp.]|nr:hypothetical protein [Candidatus Acidoferrum sp.]